MLLDPFHVHGAVKRIVHKPAMLVLDECPHQWLHMQEAQKAGLLKARTFCSALLSAGDKPLYGTNVQHHSCDPRCVHCFAPELQDSASQTASRHYEHNLTLC